MNEVHMQNLAGNQDCDRVIEKELVRCGIEIVRSEQSSGHEVDTKITGKLGSFIFTRCWYYYAVNGEVPVDVAWELYKDPVGKEDIRVAGHCGRPEPVYPWVNYRDKDGYKLIHDPSGNQEVECNSLVKKFDWFEMDKNVRFVKDAATVAKDIFVANYHIDSELGLYIFVQILKKHKLV